MTAKDVTAAYEADHGFYMDNSNVWFINLDSGDDMVFKALTMIFNSTVFSVLAKSALQKSIRRLVGSPSK